MMMTPEAYLDGLMGCAITTAHKILIEEKHDQLVPTALVVYADGESEALAMPFANDGEKAEMLLFLRDRFRKRRAIAYVIATEVWLGTPIPGAGRTREEIEAIAAQMVRPRDMPNRREAVLVVGVARGGLGRSRFFDIVRGESGKIVDLPPSRYDLPTVPLGSFTNLLDPPAGMH